MLWYFRSKLAVWFPILSLLKNLNMIQFRQSSCIAKCSMEIKFHDMDFSFYSVKNCSLKEILSVQALHKVAQVESPLEKKGKEKQEVSSIIFKSVCCRFSDTLSPQKVWNCVQDHKDVMKTVIISSHRKQSGWNRRHLVGAWRIGKFHGL